MAMVSRERARAFVPRASLFEKVLETFQVAAISRVVARVLVPRASMLA
jgi:hypothetical protein